MKAKILKQAYLPDMLEQELLKKYDLYELESLSKQELFTLSPEFKVMLTNGEAIVDRQLIEKFPKLELIANFGVGYDGIDIVAAKEKKIRVTNTPRVLTDDVADLAIGLMLTLSRQIVGAQKYVENGGWLQNSYHWTNKVSGARLGIVGFGRIGQAIAQRATGFNMKISYTNLFPIPDCQWTYYDSLITLAADSDFLIVSVPGDETNKNLINRSILDAIGPKGYLINIARGSIVDEDALVSAIKEKTLAGAALDVFKHEPNVPSELFNRDNVILTPHMASATFSTRREMSNLVLDNVNAYFEGKELITPIC